MSFKGFFQKKLFDLIAVYGQKKILKFTDGRVESLLRANIHVIEKELIENNVNFQNMIYARMFYFEALKRNLISQDEINWCQKVLFGKVNQSSKDVFYKKDNSFNDILKQRRSIRRWKDIKITKEEFEQLVDAARWAPSSCNRQPCYFILIQDKDRIEFLSKLRGQDFIKKAPSCILVLINLQAYNELTKYYFAFLDAGVAIQNMLLMAESMGLGACFVNFAPTNDFKMQKEKLSNVFNIPINFEPICIIPIGIAQEKPTPPGRKDVSTIMHFETFKNNK